MQPNQHSLLEESAVARGVRRVIAVTGAKAREAHRRGEDLFRLLRRSEVAESEGNVAAAEAGLAEAEALLSAGGQSAWRRADARERVSALRAASLARAKVAAKGRAAAMKERAVAEAAGAAEAGVRFAVARVDDISIGEAGVGFGENAKEESKLALTALKAMTKATEKRRKKDKKKKREKEGGEGLGEEEDASACMVLSASVSSGVLTVQCKAQLIGSPSSSLSSLSAKAWVVAALDSCGGRGGGTDSLAQGTAAVELTSCSSNGSGGLEGEEMVRAEVDAHLAAVERAARAWADVNMKS